MATSSEYGAFVPNTFVWDLQQLDQVEDIDPKLKELLIRLYQNLNLMALVLNIKDSAQYPVEEFVNGQLWFPNPANNSTTNAVADERQVLRKVINFGPLAVNGLNQQPHYITCTMNTSFTRIYAVATDPTDLLYIPIPYDSAGTAEGIAIYVDSTNINIFTESDRSAYTTVYCVLEYLQT